MPSASPVPGTMYPVSRREAGVGRGDAVYAWTVIPRAAHTFATVFMLAPLTRPLVQKEHTLPSNAPVSQNAHFLPDLIGAGGHVLIGIPPDVLLLRFTRMKELPRGGQPVHYGPFCHGRTVDAGAGGDGDGRVLDDRVVNEVVNTSRDSMNQFNTV